MRNLAKTLKDKRDAEEKLRRSSPMSGLTDNGTTQLYPVTGTFTIGTSTVVVRNGLIVSIV